MTLVYAIFLLIVLAVLSWAVNAYAPMQQPLKAIVNIAFVLVALGCLFWILVAIFGGAPPVPHR